MSIRCPRCRLINPPEAKRCDCGWVVGSAAPTWLETQFIQTSWPMILLASLTAWLPMLIVALIGIRRFQESRSREKAKSVFVAIGIGFAFQFVVAITVYLLNHPNV